MKRNLAYALCWIVLLLSLVAPRAAYATACNIPNTFTAGTSALASQVNANFTSLQSCGNNIDHTNIGTAGIYASQIVPDTAAHATFGGTTAYTFASGLTISGGAFSVSGSSAIFNTQIQAANGVNVSGGGFFLNGTSANTCARWNNSSGLASAGSDCETVYNTAGTALSGVHSVFISGQAPGATSACGPIASGWYCSTFTLTGNATFTSAGNGTGAPSFSCADGWTKSGQSASWFTAYLAAEPGFSGVGAIVEVQNNAPNTIYVASAAPSQYFAFYCKGT